MKPRGWSLIALSGIAVVLTIVLLVLLVYPKDLMLAAAVKSQDYRKTERLLKMGADPNAGVSLNPLHVAIRDGELVMVRLLLEHGADPNLSANYGSGEQILMHPLSLAINHNRHSEPFVRLLIGAGANPEEDGWALETAIEKGELNVVKLLIKHGGDPNQGLQSAVMSDQIEIASYLLEQGADPNAGVQLAEITYNRDMLQLLIEAGASIDMRSREERKPEDYTTTADGKKIRLR
ncbi:MULTISPECIES: ankyrin repeat domain-containing protein [unclassified Paenibacillus]|uniref:ankyrin repeat domain-containing protein n=1 Tax=unclassified Paenibacillus TaxID=185978 RepID=UPI001C12859D|nr:MULTISPECIES: ankyrin repeat domain-containing protein [unclassified Paenibacillus]MBU5444967.1 ankyrin repeat domain-containing protein [Paenibacillus sp. MSJ-34]CAH0121269.1 hypothetical protein PAE9249_03796 [Paenibacillus sp. CECT 9249]